MEMCGCADMRMRSIRIIHEILTRTFPHPHIFTFLTFLTFPHLHILTSAHPYIHTSAHSPTFARMVHYFKNIDHKTVEIDAPEEGAWVNVSPPLKQEEFSELSNNLEIPIDFLTDSLDID